MANFDDIVDDLLKKVDNEDAVTETESVDEEEKLTAKEFVAAIQALKEAKANANGAVKGIKQGSTTYYPVGDSKIVTLPGAGTQVIIATTASTDQIIATTGKVELPIRITSVDGGSDSGETVTLNVQRHVNDAWKTVKTTPWQTAAVSGTKYESLDITGVLPDGESQVRLEAIGQETGATGRLIFTSIVKATLAVTSYIDYKTPVKGSSIPLAYAVSGTGVNKTLKVKVSDNSGSNWKTYSYFLGPSTYTATNQYTTRITDAATDTVKALTHGVHKIEAWVETTDAAGTTYKSASVCNQVMVVTDATDMIPYLMIQEVAVDVENYVRISPLLKYAVYNPAGTPYTYAFVVTNYNQSKEYLRLENALSNDTISATIGIDDAVVGVTSEAYLRVYRILRDESGEITEQVNFMSASSGDEIVGIHVKNTYDFTPTADADFYLNPAVRNNNEATPNQILNAAKNNSVVASTWEGFTFSTDGWLQDDDGQNVLRILAGQHLSITGYDPFSKLASDPANSMSLELDFKVSNVTNEKDAIIAILNTVAASGKFVGLKMTPLEGVVLTSSKITEGEQNFGWREGYRTHIVLNICHALYTDASATTTIPVVRVFINGVPCREFLFDIKESAEWKTDNGYTIELGQAGADIDFYGIRCYQKALTSAMIMQNYKSTLATSAEKLAFADANDILAGDGTISYEKARKKYSCIVHYGTPTSHENKDPTTCWLHIDHFVDGVYDNATSGDICKTTKMCPVKGQGSTAMKYADWNQQYDPKKAALPSTDTTTPYIAKKNDDGTTTRQPAITVDGQLVQDGWVDGNGKYKGTYYQLNTSYAKAEKLVGKINYASSMQSHKAGATAAYNDLYRICLGSQLDTIMAANTKARCAVKEDVFLFFVQTANDSAPVYQGIMTFGAGKMDKKEWGYSSSDYPEFAMFEGADNDQPLANFQIPWDDEDVAYDAGEESFMYNKKAQIDFDAGAVDDDENPTGMALKKIKAFFNFGYLHNTNLEAWADDGGTLTSLLAATGLDTNKQYWVTNNDESASRGDLFRYCYLTKTWVPAGITKTDGVWATRNVFTENPTVKYSSQYNKVTAALQASIVSRFLADGPRYYNENSALFHSCLVQNLFAGSDNCAKNTYYVIDPSTHLVCFHADDLDTIFKTDNVGWQTKAYYVDREHHIDDEGTETYSGTHNAFFNTFDQAYAQRATGLADKPKMMNTIFVAMATLSGNVTQFFENYFFSIQRNIPAVAYQEQARVRYELREMQVQAGTLSLDTVNPITQQLGDQLQSELQYMDRRLVYFQSYAAYGDFAVGSSSAFGFRGYPKRDGRGARIAFTVKPIQYIYPTGAYGQSTINPHVRIKPGDSYELLIEEACQSDTTCSLFGINYYSSIGNIGDISVNPAYTMTVGGNRLTEFLAYPTDGSQGEFRPSSITLTGKLLEKVKINCANVGSSLSLSEMIRLADIDLEGTGLNRVRVATSTALTSLKLPEKIQEMTLTNKPNLATLTFEGYKYLTGLSITNCKTTTPTLTIVQGIYEAKSADNSHPLASLTLDNLAWTNASPELLKWLCGITTCKLSGTIALTDGQNLDSETKLALLQKFGDIDDKTNDLYITYPSRSVTSIDITTRRFIISEAGRYQYNVAIYPSTANNVKSVKWSLSAHTLGVTVNEDTGLVTVPAVGLEANNPTADLTCTLTLKDGTTKTSTITLKLFNRIPKIGDFAYSDGEFDSYLYAEKTVVGMVYKVTKYSDLPTYLLNKYLEDETIKAQHDAGKTLYEVLVQAAKDISCKTTNEDTSFSSTPWGIYPDSGSLGLTSAERDAIAAAAGLTNATVSDIPTIADYYGTTGLRNEAGTAYTDNFIRDYNAYDDTQKDGFMVYAYAVGRWDGKTTTEKIVAHASNILTNYVGEGVMQDGNGQTIWGLISADNVVPQNLTELADLLVALGSLGGGTRWRQLAYPAAFSCHLYEPTTATGGAISDLHDSYKKNHWYLPAAGDGARLYIFFRNSRALSPADSGTPTAAYSDENNADRPTEATDARRPIYANALKRAADVGKTCPITMPTQTHYWCSTEVSSGGAWYVYVSNGSVNNYGAYTYNSLCVRPVVAFNFVL